jgi:hypothetical protein
VVVGAAVVVGSGSAVEVVVGSVVGAWVVGPSVVVGAVDVVSAADVDVESVVTPSSLPHETASNPTTAITMTRTRKRGIRVLRMCNTPPASLLLHGQLERATNRRTGKEVPPWPRT